MSSRSTEARGALGSALTAAGWAVVMAGVVAFVTRSFDTPNALAARTAALTPLVRVAVGWTAASAVAARRHRLAGASLAAMLVLAPSLDALPTGADPVDRSAGQVVRISTANVLASNPDVAHALESLAASAPDVILLQEITPEHAAELAGIALDGRYPYRIDHPLPFFHGYALLSRWPIETSESVLVAGWPLVRARIQMPSGPVEIVNTHLPAPIASDGHEGWSSQLDQIGRWAAATDAPMIVAGDFNATADHHELRSLLDGELDDAWDVAGEGWGATYRDGRFPVFVLRLDHVLVSPEWGVAGIDTTSVPGSDHRGLVADLVLLDPAFAS